MILGKDGILTYTICAKMACVSLPQFSKVLRQHCRPVHRTARALHRFWADAEAPLIPAIRRFQGRTLLLHPRWLTFDLNQYEPHVLRWLSRLIKRGDCIVDAGANVGLLSLLMSKYCGNNGRVYSFEPSPTHLRLLEYHKRKNRANQICIQPLAVSNQDGMAAFFLLNEGDHYSNSLVFSEDDVRNLVEPLRRTKKEIRIPTVTLDRFCAEHQIRPSLLKIDVEGAELMVLQGAVRLLSEVRPHIILAIHPWWLPGGQTTGDIVSLLVSHGYEIQDPAGAATRTLDYCEYLCVPSTSPPEAWDQTP
jgi:FkbM family methyltransferase